MNLTVADGYAREACREFCWPALIQHEGRWNMLRVLVESGVPRDQCLLAVRLVGRRTAIEAAVNADASSSFTAAVFLPRCV